MHRRFRVPRRGWKLEEKNTLKTQLLNFNQIIFQMATFVIKLFLTYIYIPLDVSKTDIYIFYFLQFLGDFLHLANLGHPFQQGETQVRSSGQY